MAGISHQNGLKLLKSENFSDFTITCPGKVFKVHKAIISAESSYLAVCCGEKFKVRTLLARGQCVLAADEIE